MLAVKNAISYNWTNGLVEGNVNRLKNKKREMYGRCGFDQYATSNVVNNFDIRQNQTNTCQAESVHVRPVVFFYSPAKYPDKTIQAM